MNDFFARKKNSASWNMARQLPCPLRTLNTKGFSAEPKPNSWGVKSRGGTTPSGSRFIIRANPRSSFPSQSFLWTFFFKRQQKYVVSWFFGRKFVKNELFYGVVRKKCPGLGEKLCPRKWCPHYGIVSCFVCTQLSHWLTKLMTLGLCLWRRSILCANLFDWKGGNSCSLRTIPSHQGSNLYNQGSLFQEYFEVNLLWNRRLHNETLLLSMNDIPQNVAPRGGYSCPTLSPNEPPSNDEALLWQKKKFQICVGLLSVHLVFFFFFFKLFLLKLSWKKVLQAQKVVDL